MNKYLEDFCRKHGLPHVWCHGLRHTAITTLADMGHGLTDIASFGGWAKASTAGIYLDRSADRAGRMAEALAGCQQEDRITSYYESLLATKWPQFERFVANIAQWGLMANIRRVRP